MKWFGQLGRKKEKGEKEEEMVGEGEGEGSHLQATLCIIIYTKNEIKKGSVYLALLEVEASLISLVE